MPCWSAGRDWAITPGRATCIAARNRWRRHTAAAFQKRRQNWRPCRASAVRRRRQLPFSPLARARRSTLTERIVDDQAAAFAAGEGFERGGVAQAGGFFQRPVCQRTGIVEIALRFEAVAHDALLAELIAHRHFVASGSVLLRAFFDEGGAARLRKLMTFRRHFLVPGMRRIEHQRHQRRQQCVRVSARFHHFSVHPRQ